MAILIQMMNTGLIGGSETVWSTIHDVTKHICTDSTRIKKKNFLPVYENLYWQNYDIKSNLLRGFREKCSIHPKFNATVIKAVYYEFYRSLIELVHYKQYINASGLNPHMWSRLYTITFNILLTISIINLYSYVKLTFSKSKKTYANIIWLKSLKALQSHQILDFLA